jgi:hypothetical protein
MNFCALWAPFEITYGYMPHFNIPVGRWTGIPEVERRLEILREARKDAGAVLHLGKRHQKKEKGGICVAEWRRHQFTVAK